MFGSAAAGAAKFIPIPTIADVSAFGPAISVGVMARLYGMANTAAKLWPATSVSARREPSKRTDRAWTKSSPLAKGSTRRAFHFQADAISGGARKRRGSSAQELLRWLLAVESDTLARRSAE